MPIVDCEFFTFQVPLEVLRLYGYADADAFARCVVDARRQVKDDDWSCSPPAARRGRSASRPKPSPSQALKRSRTLVKDIGDWDARADGDGRRHGDRSTPFPDICDITTREVFALAYQATGTLAKALRSS